MSSPKLLLAAGLTAVSLSACGIAAKPVAGTVKAQSKIHKGVDDPRLKHINCLRQDHIAVARVGGTGLRIGSPAGGPTVTFEPTPGAAQYAQMSGQVQGAEVIGSALLYPHQASDRELQAVETCMALSVTG